MPSFLKITWESWSCPWFLYNLGFVNRDLLRQGSHIAACQPYAFPEGHCAPKHPLFCPHSGILIHISSSHLENIIFSIHLSTGGHLSFHGKAMASQELPIFKTEWGWALRSKTNVICIPITVFFSEMGMFRFVWPFKFQIFATMFPSRIRLSLMKKHTVSHFRSLPTLSLV